MGLIQPHVLPYDSEGDPPYVHFICSERNTDTVNTIHRYIIEGSFDVKLPTICRDGKAEVGRVSEEKSRSEKISDGESQQDAAARKGREVAIHCVFPMICGSGGLKSNLAKAAGGEPAGQMRDEKLHAIVARSTFPSQHVQSTPTSDHFWKVSCRKSARRCGAKHMSKSKCAKHVRFGPLLEVEMEKCTPLWREANFQVLRFGPLLEVELSKKCTPLWREAHFQVKSVKNWGVQTTFWRSDVDNNKNKNKNKNKNNNNNNNNNNNYYYYYYYYYTNYYSNYNYNNYNYYSYNNYNNYNYYSYNNYNNYSYTTTKTTTISPQLQLQLQLHHNYNYNYATTTTTTTTTLQLHHATLHKTTLH